MKAALTGKKNQYGFSTLEILIAFAVLVLTFTAVILVIFGSQSMSVDALNNDEALYKAQLVLAKARAAAKEDFNLVNPLPPTPDVSGNITYMKSLDVNMVDPFTKKITSNITWSTDPLRTQSVRLTSLITNPEGVTNNLTCNSVIANANGWKNPQHYDFDTPDILPPPHANGIAISDLHVFNSRLYITAASTPNPSPESFFVFDLPANPSQMPVLRGRIDNSPVNMGLNAVTVSGNYAFVANAYTGATPSCTQGASCAQLQVISVINPALPVVSANLKIPAVASGNRLAAGTSIFYSNGYVYLGLARAATSGNEFNVIDVGGGGGAASPTNPILRGGVRINNGINSIFVKDNIAYVASPNTENMTVIDVSVPTNPHRVGGFTPSAAPETNGVGSNHGKSLYAIGTTAYLGRTYGTTEFYILDASNPSSITEFVPSSHQDSGTGNLTSINALAVRDYLGFFITKSQFQVWNISNPSSITPWSADGTTSTFLQASSLGGTGTSLYCSGDYFYLAVASSQGNNKDIISIITPGP